MSHTFTINDDTYRALRTVAASEGQTPESLFQHWIDKTLRKAATHMDVERDVNGNRITYPSTADFLASLGADEERVMRMRALEDKAEKAGVIEQFVDAEYEDEEQ